MYLSYTISDTIRVPPSEIGGNLKKTIFEQAKGVYESILDEDIGVVIAVTDVGKIGDGKIVPGDGAVYFESEITFLAYKPKMHELVEGEISDVTEFGAFIKTGPLEGLIHVSQIMDDYINYDAKLPGFIGKETKKKLTLKDEVKARIVTISLRGTLSSSKIGLTMRQVGLGKTDWLKIDAKTAEKKKKKEDKK
ncbi:MAG: DNA-directed RNA polymerase [Candidatus Diapherotrites archaeon CG11_big_fil_rev_8_21_14_0_20_37_9]|nr:MAG: DNA-directed RNA polymerase [Candidatus Diapherotrites archaeon CG11_big_fil_rev_8_21_14_0_20_37_9]